MKESAAWPSYLAIIPAVASGLDEAAVFLDIANVKQLVVLEAEWTAGLDVRSHVVQLAQSFGELNVQLVVEFGMAKDQDSVLRSLASGRA